METLKIHVDFLTASAAENAGALVQAMDRTRDAVAAAGRVVDKAEQGIKEMGQAAGTAARHVQDVAAAGTKAATTLATTATAADEAADGLADTADAAKDAQRQLEATGESARDAAGRFVKLGDEAKGAGTATEQAGKKSKAGTDAMAEGADKAKRKTRELREETGVLGKAADGVAQGAKAMITSWLGLSTVVQLMAELAANTEKVVEARRKMGDFKLGFDSTVQDLIDNLGMNGDQAGFARARGMVSALQKRAGIADPAVATEILAKAQITGYPVAVAGDPSKDFQGPGADVASQVGAFAARTRLKPKTAGELFNLAQLQGVTDAKGMEEFLARLEQGLGQVPITDPAKGVNAIVEATAARMIAGVPMDQAVAQVAAASIGTPDPAKVDTKVNAFARVAVGMDPAKKLVLAREAMKQGKLGQGVVDAQSTPAMAERARRAQEAAAQDSAEILQLEESDRLAGTDSAADIAAAEAALALDEQAPTDASGKPRRLGAAAQQRRAQDLAEKRRALANMKRDAARAAAARQLAIRERKAGMSNRLADANRENTEEQLQLAYGTLDLGTQENVLRDATAGLSGAALQQKVLTMAGGEYAQFIVEQVGDKPREAYDRARAAMAAPNVPGLRERSAAYRESDVFKNAAGEADRQQRQLGAAGDGNGFATELLKTAETDIEVLRANGQGQTGVFAATGFIGVKGSQHRSTYSQTEAGLKAKRMAVLLEKQLRAFIAGLDPAVAAQHKAKLDQAWATMAAAYKAAMGDEGIWESGQDKLVQVQDAARQVGAVIEEIEAAPATGGAAGPQSSAPLSNPLAGKLASAGNIDGMDPALAEMIREDQLAGGAGGDTMDGGGGYAAGEPGPAGAYDPSKGGLDLATGTYTTTDELQAQNRGEHNGAVKTAAARTRAAMDAVKRARTPAEKNALRPAVAAAKKAERQARAAAWRAKSARIEEKHGGGGMNRAMLRDAGGMPVAWKDDGMATEWASPGELAQQDAAAGQRIGAAGAAGGPSVSVNIGQYIVPAGGGETGLPGRLEGLVP